MMKLPTAVFAVLLGLLAACDKPESVDIAPQREALEKAQGVESVLQQNADERRAQIDEAEKQ